MLRSTVSGDTRSTRSTRGICPPWVLSRSPRSRPSALCPLPFDIRGLLNASPPLNPNAESLSEPLTYFAIGVDRTGRWPPVSQSLQGSDWASRRDSVSPPLPFLFNKLTCLHSSVPTGTAESSGAATPSQAVSVLRGSMRSGPFPCACAHPCPHG